MARTWLPEQSELGRDAREQRLAFLKLTDEDRQRLAELAPIVARGVDGLVKRFYEHLLSFPGTAKFLEDPGLVERLKKAQREHFLSLMRAVHDEAYFESRLRVGMAHARVNLEPQWYLGAYAVQLGYMIERLFETFGHEPERLAGYLLSFVKVIILDIGLATDAYIYSGYVERSLAEAHAREARRATEALEARAEEEARKETLISMVVHDIRSPVTAMIATARAGLRRYKDEAEPPGKQFKLIEGSGANVLHIIDNILTLARMSQGEFPVQLEAFDLAALVRSCVEELRPFAQQTGHSVTVTGAQPLPAHALDRTLVRRIISNLLVNAFRHTPAGGQVLVSCQGHGNRCAIRVADDGPGVPARVAERLFEQPPAEHRRSEGAYVDSGLGLPFCRLACERLGGSIWLDRDAGAGACFVVELPLR